MNDVGVHDEERLTCYLHLSRWRRPLPERQRLSFRAKISTTPNSSRSAPERGIGSLPDDRFLDTQMENIKRGGTVENAVAYELDDLKTPVDLVAVEVLGDEIGRMQYEIE